MKTYDCKITFKSICDESDLKEDQNEIYEFLYKKIWNLGNFKFEFKENKKLTKKDIKKNTTVGVN
jgi:hypothetical protein